MKLQKGIYSEEELVPSKRGGVSASSGAKGGLGKFINLIFSALSMSVQMSSSHVLES